MRARGVPRGPPEWGELLYEPRWAAERRFNDPAFIYLGAVCFVTAFAILLLPFILAGSAPPGDRLAFFAAMMVFAVCAFLMGWLITARGAMEMPFRIYSRGFTLHTASSLKDGLQRRETLVPLEDLTSVEVGRDTLLGHVWIFLLNIWYKGRSGKAEAIRVGNTSDDDPLAIMLALKSLVPGKLDKSLEPYVGEGAEDRVLTVPLEDAVAQGDRVEVWVALGTLVMGCACVGLMMGSSGVAPPTVLLALAFSVGFSIYLIPMLQDVAKREALSAFEAGGRIHGRAIVYELPPATGLFVEARSSLPLQEVAMVRKVLHPVLFGHKTLIVTTGGRTLIAKHSLFEALSAHPGFERSGFAVINRGAMSSGGVAVAERSWTKGVLLGLLNVLLAMVAMAASGLSGEIPPRAITVLGILGSVFFTLLMVYVGYLKVQASRRASLYDGLAASEGGITVPVSPKRTVWVPREKVGAITTARDRISIHVRLETGLGTFTLPVRAAEQLKEAGYQVDDILGVVQVERPAH